MSESGVVLICDFCVQTSVILPRAADFQRLIRMQNTNVNGKHKVGFALRIIKGIGRRFAILVCKIAQIDLDRRAGDLLPEEIDKICDIFAKPTGKFFGPMINFGVLNFYCNFRVRNSIVVLEQTKVH